MTEELYAQMYEEVESLSYKEKYEVSTWCKVLAIFGKYGDGGIECAASHDQFFVGPRGISSIDGFEIEEEDAKSLISAGWSFGEESWFKFV